MNKRIMALTFMLKYIVILLCVFQLLLSYSKTIYFKEQFILNSMLNGTIPPDLRQAVYSVENTYFNGEFHRNDYCKKHIIHKNILLKRNILHF